MEHLLSGWRALEKRLASGALLLLMDYDGTLTPIMKRPEEATISADMRRLLARLLKHYPTAIISGRALKDIRKLVGLRKIYYAGNHGLEIYGPGLKLVKPEAKKMASTVSKICVDLRSELGDIDGTIVEDKGLTASVHYRLVAPEKLRGLKRIFTRITKPHIIARRIKIARGKKVLEIRPNIDWDKGKAVLWIIDALKPRGRVLPIYLGDDKTDEDAFRALKNKGITILVSNTSKKSNAEYFLRNVNEVKEFLKKLIPNGHDQN
jgi:trehalose 6-phosphate phosphatase